MSTSKERRFEDLVEVIRNAPNAEEVREAAILLGDLGDIRAVPHLIDLLNNAKTHIIWDGAAIGLRELADQRAFWPLVHKLQDNRTLDHRGTLAFALSSFNCTDIVEFLVDMYISESYEVQIEIRSCFDNIDINEIKEDLRHKMISKVKAAFKNEKDSQKKIELRYFLEDILYNNSDGFAM